MENVRLSRQLALCRPASTVKPRPYRPDRDFERTRDLLVAEIAERVEE